MNLQRLVPLAALTSAVAFAVGLPMRTAEADSGQELTRILLEELPQPPADIRALLELAKVSFQTGDRDVEPIDQANQPGRSPRRLAGETSYKIDYSYNIRCRWRTRENGGKRNLAIKVSFLDVSFDRSHTIWFRKRPETDRFWEDRLVLHELDHVKISSDPALETRFAELLRDNSALQRPVEPDTVIDEALVLRLVDQHVEELFEQVSQLIAIRYREIDRVTDHGIQPLPADSPLSEFLRPPAGKETRSE